MVHHALAELVVDGTLLQLAVALGTAVHDLAPLGRRVVDTMEMSILAQKCVLLLDIMMNTLLEGVYVRVGRAVGG